MQITWPPVTCRQEYLLLFTILCSSYAYYHLLQHRNICTQRRARWLSVLHWVFWVNSWHDQLYYKLLHGDKDTFALGFALAGQAQHYRQVFVPPGGAFMWGVGQLEMKCKHGEACRTAYGWQLVGALQHDNYGVAALLSCPQQPGPEGSTKGVGWERTAPASAVRLLHIGPLPHITLPSLNGTSWSQNAAHLKHSRPVAHCSGRRSHTQYRAAGLPSKTIQCSDEATRLQMLSKALQVLGAAMLTVAFMLWMHQMVLPSGNQQYAVHAWARQHHRSQTEAADCATISKQLWTRPHLHPALYAINTSFSLGASDATTSRNGSSGSTSGSSRSVGSPESTQYLTDVPADSPMAQSRQQLQQYLSSPEFAREHAEMLAQQQLGNKRGILIAAGGKKLTAQLVVLLKVLREVVHCTLPVEVAWLGDQEMDDNTLAALQQRFGPLTGFNAQAVAFPSHHREVPRTHWVGKVAALLHCRYHEVLLLDCDNLPLVDPAQHFSDPLYQQAGNLFWPDFWADWVKPGVWRELGLNRTAVQPLLSAGAGWSGRDAETGMLLIDRARWLAVLHWVFWVNSWHDRLYYKLLHGDKDTFALGFALAGQAQHYRQVSVPPGGAFQWSPDALQVKCPSGQVPNTCGTQPGWQLLGALQHDNYGRAAFFHRTVNKLLLHEQPWPAKLATGPLPRRWARYHLAHNSQGPTKGVHNIHAAPDSAFQKLRIDPLPYIAVPAANSSSWQHQTAHITLQLGGKGSSISTDAAQLGGNKGRRSWSNRHRTMTSNKVAWVEMLRAGHAAACRVPAASNSVWQSATVGNSSSSSKSSCGCPLVLFSQYLQAVQLGLPLQPKPELECACSQLLQQIQQTQLEDDSTSIALESCTSLLKGSAQQRLPLPVFTAEYLHSVVRDLQGEEVPDGSPVPALLHTTQLESMPSVFGVVEQSHVALEWLKSEEGKAAFPALFDGSMA